MKLHHFHNTIFIWFSLLEGPEGIRKKDTLLSGDDSTFDMVAILQVVVLLLVRKVRVVWRLLFLLVTLDSASSVCVLHSVESSFFYSVGGMLDAPFFILPRHTWRLKYTIA